MGGKVRGGEGEGKGRGGLTPLFFTVRRLCSVGYKFANNKGLSSFVYPLCVAYFQMCEI